MRCSELLFLNLFMATWLRMALNAASGSSEGARRRVDLALEPFVELF